MTLLGDEATVQSQAAELGLQLAGAQVVDPAASDLLKPLRGRVRRPAP